MRVAWPIEEHLTLQDEATSTLKANLEVESKLHMFGEAIAVSIFNETATETLDVTDSVSMLHKMVEAVTESLTLTDAVSDKMSFNPTIVETLAIAGAVEILNTLNDTITETLAATDTTKWGWLESISETLDITDAVTVKWVLMEILTESLELTEEALLNLTFNDTISESLECAATTAMKLIMNDIVEETLNLGVIVELDDELWQTWVLSTDQFHASVYSGYSFNSYAVYANTAFGCKTDGIYKLSGTQDDGVDFVSGIVLPETNFGTTRDKRFRKAYFGLAGGVSPALRVETDSGSTTYSISSEKVNIGRDMKGKKWVLKIQDWDSLDFVELVPIILAR